MIANKFSQDNDFYGISKKDILNKIDSVLGIYNYATYGGTQ